MVLDIYKNIISIDIEKYIEYNKINLENENNEIKKKILKGRYPIDMLRKIVYLYEKFKNKYGDETNIKINNNYVSKNIIEYKKIIKKILYNNIILNKSIKKININLKPE